MPFVKSDVIPKLNVYASCLTFGTKRIKNIKISYFPKLGHYVNYLFFRQQMLGDLEFGHLQIKYALLS